MNGLHNKSLAIFLEDFLDRNAKYLYEVYMCDLCDNVTLVYQGSGLNLSNIQRVSRLITFSITYAGDFVLYSIGKRFNKVSHECIVSVVTDWCSSRSILIQQDYCNESL